MGPTKRKNERQLNFVKENACNVELIKKSEKKQPFQNIKKEQTALKILKERVKVLKT